MKNSKKYSKFKKLFQNKTDPWGMDNSPYEKERFGKMIDILKTIPHKSILEIGCAEGHLTKLLTAISNDVTALDVSEDAIERAKKRSPRTKYFNSSIDDFKTNRKFDVVVASEVIYYIRNKKPIFEKIAKLAPYLLMSNYMLWDYILAFNLKNARLQKTVHHLKLSERAKYCRISLWKLSNQHS